MKYTGKQSYLENDYVEIWIENNTVIEIFKPDTIIDMEAGKKIIEDRMKVSNGVPMPIFVDMRNMVSMDNKTRDFMGTEDAVINLTHGAFLISSIFNRLLANMYMKFNTPPVPVKFFTSEKPAFEWIDKIRELQRFADQKN